MISIFGLGVINRTNKETLQGKINGNIQAKSTVVTDDFRGYLGLKGFNHKTVNHSAKEYVNGMVLIPTALRVFGRC